MCLFRRILGLFAFVAAALGGWATAPAALTAGNLLVTDFSLPGLIEVNTSNGTQTVVSQAQSFVHPMGVAIGPLGQIYVIDQDAVGGRGALFEVDPATGTQKVITSGGLFVDPVGVAVAPDGGLLIADQESFGGPGAIIRVDAVTGAQTAVSFGGNFLAPSGLVVSTDGELYVVDWAGKIIRVNPITGSQSIVAFGGDLANAIGIGQDANGHLLVTSAQSRESKLLRIDRVSGLQSIVTVGEILFTPQGVAGSGTEDIFVVDRDGICGPIACHGAIIRINGPTGHQMLLSSGNFFQNPSGITLIPNVPTPLQSRSWGRLKAAFR